MTSHRSGAVTTAIFGHDVGHHGRYHGTTTQRRPYIITVNFNKIIPVVSLSQQLCIYSLLSNLMILISEIPFCPKDSGRKRPTDLCHNSIMSS